MNTDAQTPALRLQFVRRLCAFGGYSVHRSLSDSRVGIRIYMNSAEINPRLAACALRRAEYPFHRVGEHVL